MRGRGPEVPPQHVFLYWYGSATGFWHQVGYAMAVRQWAIAAFFLHQATERYCHAVLLVFTGYKPKSHNIEQLTNDAAALHPALVGAMPRDEGENDRLFKLPRRAYIAARYSKSYRITKKSSRCSASTSAISPPARSLPVARCSAAS